ncbi:MAG: flagellar FliJ family protein [Rhodospirillales bacterium]
MSRAIANLIRLHGWRIDEHRRAVAAAGRRVEEVSAAIVALDEAFRREQDHLRAGADHDFFGFASYADHVRTQHSELRTTLAAAEAELADARQRLAEAYREGRKFEMLKADLDRAAAIAAARREQRRLDETAVIMGRAKALR